MLLTPHFHLEELCVTSNKQLKETNLIEAEKHIGKMYMLAGFAERVREIIGLPMTITSGYRCKELNKAVGGVSNSQHLSAEAIDFTCRGMTTEQIACKIISSDLRYRQLIIEHSKSKCWVHISIGDGREVLRYKNGKYTKLGELK